MAPGSGLVLASSKDNLRDQELSLLQFVHSSQFEQDWGQLLAKLLKSLAGTFGQYFNSVSLQHATLAFAATCAPSTISDDEIAMFHSSRACAALRMLTSNSLEEADLYAALLLTLLATIKGDVAEYAVHLKEFEAVMRELKLK